MAFKLNSVVPWGRNIDEYKKMFLLGEEDKNKRIAGFGDGPASFNCESTKKGFNVVSYDPIYQFSKSDIADRIEEVRVIVMKQMAENMENYIWKSIKNLKELEEIRMSAMKEFLDANESKLTSDVINYFKDEYEIDILDTQYEFQKCANRLMIIRKK